MVRVGVQGVTKMTRQTCQFFSGFLFELYFVPQLWLIFLNVCIHLKLLHILIVIMCTDFVIYVHCSVFSVFLPTFFLILKKSICFLGTVISLFQQIEE